MRGMKRKDIMNRNGPDVQYPIDFSAKWKTGKEINPIHPKVGTIFWVKE